MAKYCDTKLLEMVWGKWIFAKQTPELEDLRRNGLVWVKITGKIAEYCVATSEPHNFEVTDRLLPQDLERIKQAVKKPISIKITDKLASDNYNIDYPASQYWDKLVSMIYSICNGLTLKFNLPSEEERHELAHEALGQVLNKIIRGKLRFEPGRAPVFNLLTTAIIRIMYSIKNKEKRQLINQTKLVDDITCGKNMPNLRSLTVSRSDIGARKP